MGKRNFRLKKRYKRSQFKKTKSKIKVWVAGFMIGIFFLLFNETGFVKWIKLKNKKQETSNVNTQLLTQQANLSNEINKLENDEEYLEKIARERFMFVKKGEKVFRVIDNKRIKN